MLCRKITAQKPVFLFLRPKIAVIQFDSATKFLPQMRNFQQRKFIVCSILFSLLALFILPNPSFSQKRKAKSKKELKAAKEAAAQMVARLQGHVAILASDSLEGRRTGTAGEEKAVDYLVKQYQAMGIGFPASLGKYVQPFTIDEGKIAAPNASLQVGTMQMTWGKDYFAPAFSKETVFGSSSSLALMESGSPWWINLKDSIAAHGNNPHFLWDGWLRTTAEQAAAKGASLVIFYSENAELPFAFNSKDRAPKLAIPVLALTPEGYKAAGLQADASPYLEGNVAFAPKTRTGHNVVAWLNNNAPLTIVLGAHLDHLGYGEDENSRHTGAPAIHNGADDNASGTATLLELARQLQQNGSKSFNYLFTHFSGEELGLFGSKYLAEHLPAEAGAINYMMNMDMVGRLDPTTKTLTIGGLGTSPSWGSIIPGVSQTGLTYKIDSSGTGPSDHTSFYRKDLPVLFFFTGLHTDYHKPSDDAELLNYEGMATIVKLLMQIIDNSSTQDKLAFTKTREQSMGTARFKVSLGIMPDYTFSGTGVKADGVIDNRPGQKAGMQTGDIILQLGDYLITGMDTYMDALSRFNKGDKTQITVKRGADVKALAIEF